MNDIDGWMHNNMMGVLLGIEVLWVSGFLAVFVVYFLVRRRVMQNRRRPPER